MDIVENVGGAKKETGDSIMEHEMTTNLIAGVNPLVISVIEFKKFKRWGKHPMYYRTLKNSKSWKARLKYWLVGHENNKLQNYVRTSGVYIYSSERTCIGYVVCKSNREAKEMCERLNHDLDDFLRQLKKTA